MTKQEALKIINKNAPCPHDMTQVLGSGNWLKCQDCGYMFATESHEKLRQYAFDYDEAIETLRR